MKKGLFSGWREVFSFTFRQGTNQKGFKNATVGIALLMLLIGLAISTIMAFVQKKDATKVSNIEKVYVIDESGLEVLYLDSFTKEQGESFPKVTFEYTEKDVKALSTQLGENAPNDVILQITRQEEGYLLSVILPEGCEISESEGEDLNDALLMSMEQSKLLSSGIPMEKLVTAMSSVSVTQLDAGEEERSIGEELVSMLLPMLIMFIMYFMVLVYGQSIGNIVSVEKSSKLMEMLLTLTRPYGLIFGKVFAMTVVAILQVVLWIAALVGGFFLGHFVAGQYIYPEYSNVLLEVFALLQGQDGSTAFSISAMALGLFTICLSFLFYCMLAGLVASFASKAEELAQVMAYYQIIMIAGFFAAYMLPLQEKDWINTILRIVPVTSAFILPGDILVGNITVLQGVLYVAILLAATMLVVVITGKIYKNQLFYKGKSVAERLHRKKAKA